MPFTGRLLDWLYRITGTPRNREESMCVACGSVITNTRRGCRCNAY